MEVRLNRRFAAPRPIDDLRRSVAPKRVSLRLLSSASSVVNVLQSCC